MNADRRTILKMCASGVLAQSLYGESALAQTAHRFPTAEITMSERTCSAWAHTTLHVWPEKYLLVSLPTSAVPEAAKIVGLSTGTFAALVLERDEVSLTLPESVWSAHAMKASAQDGPYRAVSFDLNLGLEVFGYFAPAAVRLANEGISIVPQSAYLKDHVLVHDKDLDKTVATLENLIKDCKQAK